MLLPVSSNDVGAVDVVDSEPGEFVLAKAATQFHTRRMMTS